MLTKIWTFLNGNKTLICSFILYALTLDLAKENINADVISLMEYIFLALGGASLAHRVKKGLTTKEEVE